MRRMVKDKGKPAYWVEDTDDKPKRAAKKKKKESDE